MIAMNFDNIYVHFRDANFLFIKIDFPEIVSRNMQVTTKPLLKQEICTMKIVHISI